MRESVSCYPGACGFLLANSCGERYIAAAGTHGLLTNSAGGAGIHAVEAVPAALLTAGEETTGATIVETFGVSKRAATIQEKHTFGREKGACTGTVDPARARLREDALLFLSSRQLVIIALCVPLLVEK